MTPKTLRHVRIGAVSFVVGFALASAAVVLADPSLPDPRTPEGKLAGVGLLLAWIGVGLWNRRGTKTVENKTDQQTDLLLGMAASNLKLHEKIDGVGGGLTDLRAELQEVRKVQEDNDALTTEELANLSEKVSGHGADLKALAATVAGHDQKITVLVDGLARVQSVANLRSTDARLAEGTVAALTPSAPKGDPA